MTARPTFAKADETFSDLALYGSRAWVAARLGKKIDWLYRNIDTLQGRGFPKIDPVMNAFLKADVDKWIAAQSEATTVALADQTESAITINRENLNAF